jgi:hypothetical protein
MGKPVRRFAKGQRLALEPVPRLGEEVLEAVALAFKIGDRQ